MNTSMMCLSNTGLTDVVAEPYSQSKPGGSSSLWFTEDSPVNTQNTQASELKIKLVFPRSIALTLILCCTISGTVKGHLCVLNLHLMAYDYKMKNRASVSFYGALREWNLKMKKWRRKKKAWKVRRRRRHCCIFRLFVKLLTVV